MKLFNNKTVRSAACLLISAAMLPAVLPANAEPLLSADSAVSTPDGAGLVFLAQPLSEVLAAETSLITAYTGFDWTKAFLVDENGNIVEECYGDREEPWKINADVTPGMAGMTLRSYKKSISAPERMQHAVHSTCMRMISAAIAPITHLRSAGFMILLLHCMPAVIITHSTSSVVEDG